MAAPQQFNGGLTMKGDTMAAAPETIGHGLELGPDGKPVKGAALKFYREEAKRVTAQLNTPTPPALGRPTIYSPELADKICQQIAEGKSLISITRQDGMPEPGSVYNWLRKYPDFLHKYSIARQDAADTLADEILRISDELEHATDPIQIQAARLRVESRRWIASRLKPQTWGDKASVEVTGADGAPLPLVTVQFVQPGAKQVEGEVIEGHILPPSGMKG